MNFLTIQLRDEEMAHSVKQETAIPAGLQDFTPKTGSCFPARLKALPFVTECDNRAAVWASSKRDSLIIWYLYYVLHCHVLEHEDGEIIRPIDPAKLGLSGQRFRLQISVPKLPFSFHY